jgi:hypothetical protein
MTRTIALAIIVATLWAANAQAELPRGVTEVRVQRNVTTDGDFELIHFPRDSQSPTYRVFLRSGNPDPWDFASDCLVFVEIADHALPLKVKIDDSDNFVDGDYFINDAGVDELRPMVEGGTLLVSQTGETLRFPEALVTRDQFGCWTGLALEYAPRLRMFYRQ